MPDILHRFSIDAPRGRVHELIATKEGVERWWNAHPNTGDDTTLQVFFGGDDPAAVMHVVEETPEQHGCSTNWGAYLTSLKSGAERGEFAAYPAGEMSRWS
jgi:uncharacterized protein YndB with AHSA1/START domain